VSGSIRKAENIKMRISRPSNNLGASTGWVHFISFLLLEGEGGKMCMKVSFNYLGACTGRVLLLLKGVGRGGRGGEVVKQMHVSVIELFG